MIKKGDLIDIMVEITDGDTSNPAESRRLVDDIEKAGVKVAGIRFGYGVKPDRIDEHERPEERLRREAEESAGSFDAIWNNGAITRRGHRIWGANQITQKLKEVLADYIREDGGGG